MASTVAQLNVKVGGDTSEAKGKLNELSGHVNTVGSHFKSALGNILGMAAGIGVIGAVGAATGFLVGQMKDVIAQGMSQQKVMTETDTVLKSMGGSSGQTAKSVGEYADSMARATGISDDLIQHSENVLLTFGNIGGKVFPAATTAALNMSTMLGQDLQSSIIQVGKALNDPIKGITALSRVGVSFSEVEKTNIKTMMEHNNVAGAQGVIMYELNKQFGGAAVAAGTTFGGQMARLNVVMDQAKEKIGLALIPILSKLLTAIQPVIGMVGSLVSNGFALLIGAIKNLSPLFETLKEDAGIVLEPLKGLWTDITLVVQSLNPFKSGIGDVGNALADFFGDSQPGWMLLQKAGDIINNVDIAFIDLVNGIRTGTGPMGQLKGIIGVVIATFKDWQQTVASFELGALRSLWTALTTQIFPTLTKLAGVIVATVIPIVRTLFQVFHDDILPILRTLWSVIQANVIPALSSIWATIASKLLPALENLWSKISPILIPALQILGSTLKQNLIPAFQLIGWVLGNVVGPALNLIINIIATLIDWLANAIGKIGDFLGVLGHIKDAVGGALGGIGNGLHDAHIPGFAVGGVMAQGGLAVVGERGPEVVALPGGSRVYPNGTGPKMGATYNITMNGTNLGIQDLQRELWVQAVLHG